MSKENPLVDDEQSAAAEVAFKGIAASVVEDAPALPALVFIEHILQPMLDNNRELLMGNWLRCAGNLQRAIRVVGEGDKLIGVAPGLLVTAETQLTRGGRDANSGTESMGDVLDMYQRKAGISPAMAQVYLQDRWNERNFRQINPYQMLLQWNELATKLGCEVPFKQIRRVDGLSDSSAPEVAQGTVVFTDDFDE